jgi:hypothetical protein
MKLHSIIFLLLAFDIFHNSCNDSLFFFRTSFSFWASYEDKISFDNCKFYFFQSCASELRRKTRFLSTIVHRIFFKSALLNFVQRQDFLSTTVDSFFFSERVFEFRTKTRSSFDNNKFYFFQNCASKLRMKTRFLSTTLDFISFKARFWTSYEDKTSFDNCRSYFFQSYASELRTKTRFLSTTAKLRALLNFVRRRDFFRQQQSCTRFWTLYEDEISFDQQL